MKLSERVRRHLQSHVVAYIALFVALSGTALALPGKNKVKSNDIARSAVKGKAIADGAVGKAKLRSGVVSSSKLGAGAVSSAALADSAVTSPKLAEDSVTRGKIVQGAINGGKIANGAIDSAKVDDGSLLGADFGPGQLSDGFALTAQSGSFTTQRAGRVFVTATFVATCATPACDDNYAVEVDGAPVTGDNLTLPPGEGARQFTLVGLTGPLEGGNYAIALDDGGGTATETHVRLAGILLQ